MGSKGSLKAETKNWREIKKQRKKWKEERTLKKLKKIEESKNVNSQPSEVISETEEDFFRTFSLAVPSSVLQNAQSDELRAYLAGQIARAACIYKMNEIIVFDDGDESTTSIAGVSKTTKFCIQFARLLQYLECPQYLRKSFFPIHNNLQYAGIMNPLDAPHHLRQGEDFPYREGITTDKPVKNGKGTYVNVGLLKQVLIDKTVQPGLRVTVKMNPLKVAESKKLRGVVVSPETPSKDLNVYWGYNVRIAHSLSEIFVKSPYEGGYDLTIGTSDKGKNIDEVRRRDLKNYKHCLIVFGGLHGLESALENDNSNLDVDDVSLLFDFYLNTCPEQGSRTIRTEEAILITLAELRKKIFYQKKCKNLD